MSMLDDNDPFCRFADMVGMGNGNDGMPLFIEFTEKVHDQFFIFLIQISCRFIGKNEDRIIDQSSCDTHALLFAPESSLGR